MQSQILSERSIKRCAESPEHIQWIWDSPPPQIILMSSVFIIILCFLLACKMLMMNKFNQRPKNNTTLCLFCSNAWWECLLRQSNTQFRHMVTMQNIMEYNAVRILDILYCLQTFTLPTRSFSSQESHSGNWIQVNTHSFVFKQRRSKLRANILLTAVQFFKIAKSCASLTLQFTDQTKPLSLRGQRAKQGQKPSLSPFYRDWIVKEKKTSIILIYLQFTHYLNDL